MNKIAVRTIGIVAAIVILPIAIASAMIAVPLAVAIGICKYAAQAIDEAIAKEEE